MSSLCPPRPPHAFQLFFVSVDGDFDGHEILSFGAPKAVNKGFFRLTINEPGKPTAPDRTNSSLFVGGMRPSGMADVSEVVQRSMSINENWAHA